jgi:hypothetical protein
MIDDVVLNKTEIIKRCIRRAKEEHGTILKIWKIIPSRILLF